MADTCKGELGWPFYIRCQLRPEHGGEHWSRLDPIRPPIEGHVFWEWGEDGEVKISFTIYGPGKEAAALPEAPAAVTGPEEKTP